MTNVVQIKRSATTATPPALADGELAYSSASENLFIGEPGNVIHKIGGKGTADKADAALPSASFTDVAVTSKLLTNFLAAGGTIAATDTILEALNKIVANATASTATADAALPAASFTSIAVTSKVLTNFLSGAGAVAATDTILQAINKLDGNVATKMASAAFTDAAVTGKLLTGFSAGVGTVSDADSLLQAINKIVANIAAAQTAAQSYADGLVVGLWDDRGDYDASGDTWPATGGSGGSGAINKGDIWTISVAGVLGGVPVATRQTVRALVNTPGQTATNWAIGLANTDVDDSITNGITGRAPSQNAVYDALALKADASTTITTSSTVDGGTF